jgi:integrase
MGSLTLTIAEIPPEGRAIRKLSLWISTGKRADGQK